MKKIIIGLIVIVCSNLLQGQGFSLSLDIDADANDGRYMIKSHSGTFIIYCSGFCMPGLISCNRLIEVNDKGEILKEKLLEDVDSSADVPTNFIQVNDGGFVYAHSKFNSNTNKFEMYIYKRDENFELLWGKKINYGSDNIIRNVVEAANGDILACGWTNNSNVRRSFLLCINGENQSVKWYKLLGEDTYHYAITIINLSSINNST
ncbi:MAG: hypothetical protein R2798_03190 [Chitinophagales bacterium]|nr:hypothetical protein [Chitinophagales bacterium]